MIRVTARNLTLPGQSLDRGDVVRLSLKMERQLIARGHAVKVPAPKKKKARTPPKE